MAKQPDFEGFARAILENQLEYGWMDGLEGDELHSLAEAHAIIVKEPYDPARHGDSEADVEPGGDWWVPWYAREGEGKGT